jgi:hypothetical protein
MVRKIIGKPLRAIENIFIQARSSTGVAYCLTLLRAEGWVNYGKEPIDAFYDELKSLDPLNFPLDKQRELFISLLSKIEIFELLLNLLNNGLGINYRIHPFKTYKKDFTHLKELNEVIETYKKTDSITAFYLKKVFYGEIINLYEDVNSSLVKDKEILNININLINFLRLFIETYKKVLLGFKDSEKITKLPDYFITVELLTNDNGLYGIKFYAPGGGLSLFIRTDKGTQQQSYGFNQDGEITLNIMGDTQLFWVYDNKPLFERGIKGRYNPIGEWRPIVYPGSSSYVSSEVHKRAKDNPDKRIEACLFYCIATCYHSIEFIVKTDIDLPFEYTTAESDEIGQLHFHKVKIDVPSNSASNLVVYDCTLELKNIEIDTIKNSLSLIEVFLHRLSFRANGKIEWFLKYPLYSHDSGKLTISKKDFRSVRKYMLDFKSEDMNRIDTSISWFINGNISPNPFTKFLSYYIAFESLAIPFIDGKLEVSKSYRIKSLSKSKRNAEIDKCIECLHKELYPEKPQEFVRKAYGCIGSLNEKTKKALEKVFGRDSKEVKEFYEKVDGFSFYNLRNKLAHGDFSHIEEKDRSPIEGSLPILKNIIYKFIIALSSKGNKKSSHLYFSHSLSIQTSDPRSSSIVSSLSMIPNKDWRIKLEWLF